MDYGSDKRSFLEAVPTYTNVIPALQLGNAGMLLALANLTESLGGSAADVAAMRGNGTAIVADAVKFSYIPGTGFWQCLDFNGTSSGVHVRALSDFMYAGQALGVTAGNASAYLPASLRSEAVAYFNAELLANGWVRALSLLDPVMANVESMTPGVEALVAMRPDWTGTGGYGGLAGVAVDSLADLEQGLGSAMAALHNLSLAARVSMPAQGVAVMSPPYIAAFLNNNDGKPVPVGPYAPAWPEFFDEKDFPAWWPNTERSLQNAVGAITDSFIRTVFGWRPAWVAAAGTDPSAAIQASLFLPNAPRGGLGFNATLSGLRTPYGLIDISATAFGLAWTWSAP